MVFLAVELFAVAIEYSPPRSAAIAGLIPDQLIGL